MSRLVSVRMSTQDYVDRTLQVTSIRPMLRDHGEATIRPVSYHARSEVVLVMVRSVARRRAFPILAWAYVVALGVQVFFAGMYVFVGASNIELHRNMAHLIGLTHALLFVAAVVGRVAEMRAIATIFGLLVLQGMLVHVGQWFGWWTIAALHPVNALVLTYAVFALAKRSTGLWTEPDSASRRVAGPAAEPVVA